MTEKPQKLVSIHGTVSIGRKLPDDEVEIIRHALSSRFGKRVIGNAPIEGELVYDIREELEKARGTLGTLSIQTIDHVPFAESVVEGDDDDQPS